MSRVAIIASILLAGCTPPAPAPDNKTADSMAAEPQGAARPEPANIAAPSGASWLVGTWSFDTSCATDFLITYEPDGVLDNRGETGTWSLAGDTVTETLTARLENGGEEPVQIEPAETRSYKAVQTDATHGVLTVNGRQVPIMRC